MARPTFSIVLPTRNRAGLLRLALQTVLEQTFDDFEVVIADNASTDDTPEVVASFGDGRLRHLRSGEALPVVPNWERGIAAADGEWVVILGDDDALVPSHLERVAAATETGRRAVSWRKSFYVHPDTDPPWPRPEEVNSLTVHPYSGDTVKLASAPELQRLFERRETELRPEMNSAVHRDVLEVIRERAGRVLGEPDPACSLCAAILAIEPAWVAIDLPLGVYGISASSISLAFLHNVSEVHATVSEYESGRLFGNVPLDLRSAHNLMAESLVRLKEALPAELAGYELDLANYFVTTYEELTNPLRQADDTAAIAHWRDVFEQQPPELRRLVKRTLSRRRARRSVRRLLRQVPLLARARWAAQRRLRGTSPFRVMHGEDAGFSSIVGATRFLERELRELP